MSVQIEITVSWAHAGNMFLYGYKVRFKPGREHSLSLKRAHSCVLFSVTSGLNSQINNYKHACQWIKVSNIPLLFLPTKAATSTGTVKIVNNCYVSLLALYHCVPSNWVPMWQSKGMDRYALN